MTDLGSSGFSHFDRLLAIVQRTRELLDAVAGEGELPAGGADYLADATLPHLEGIQDGFRMWLRAETADRAELSYLIGHAAAVRAAHPSVESATPADRTAAFAEASAEARLHTRVPAIREPETWHLAALAHARLVLALLPRMPEGAVRFPAGRRSYADIAAPRGPAELAERIDELERELWQTAIGRGRASIRPAFRRTYGFFDAAEMLGRNSIGAEGPGFGLAG